MIDCKELMKYKYSYVSILNKNQIYNNDIRNNKIKKDKIINYFEENLY